MSMLTDNSVSSPHTHISRTVTDVMQQVALALIPGVLVSCYFFGIGILFNILLAIVFAVFIEAAVLKMRKMSIAATLKDGTAIVTAMLFALAISPFTSWWVSLVGIAFAIIVAKHLYGGIGANPFNPAMAGYVFVLLCFPVELAYWPGLTANSDAVSFLDSLKIIMSVFPEATDGLSGATPLSNMKLELSQMNMISEIMSGPLYGALGGAAWQWIGVAYLAGGIWLLLNRIIRWQIPVAILGSLFVISMLCNMIDSDIYPSAMFHLFTGGTMLCAFFIATDPASSSTTPVGKIIYGIGIGFFIYIIRTWGSYPDGVAFAVLLMNAMVPMIDYYTRPKVLGEK